LASLILCVVHASYRTRRELTYALLSNGRLAYAQLHTPEPTPEPTPGDRTPEPTPEPTPGDRTPEKEHAKNKAQREPRSGAEGGLTAQTGSDEWTGDFETVTCAESKGLARD